jgi:hypothetical protein
MVLVFFGFGMDWYLFWFALVFGSEWLRLNWFKVLFNDHHAFLCFLVDLEEKM